MRRVRRSLREDYSPLEAALVPDGDGGRGLCSAKTTPSGRRSSCCGGRGTAAARTARQQVTFSPPGTTEEIEDYCVNLDGVTALELRVVPTIGGGGAVASVERMQVAGG